MLNLQRFGAPLAMILGVLISDPALAYIGPGAGLGAVAVTVALVLGVLLLVMGLVWYPMKRLLKKKTTTAASHNKNDGTE